VFNFDRFICFVFCTTLRKYLASHFSVGRNAGDTVRESNSEKHKSILLLEHQRCDSGIRFGGNTSDGQLYTTVEEGAPMNKRMVQGTWFLSALTLLAVSIAGCGRETINVPDTTPPHVVSTVPALGVKLQ
jgi:hypothetical protein